MVWLYWSAAGQRRNQVQCIIWRLVQLSGLSPAWFQLWPCSILASWCLLQVLEAAQHLLHVASFSCCLMGSSLVLPKGWWSLLPPRGSSPDSRDGCQGCRRAELDTTSQRPEDSKSLTLLLMVVATEPPLWWGTDSSQPYDPSETLDRVLQSLLPSTEKF